MNKSMIERKVKKCQGCGELDMIEASELKCKACREDERRKHKSLLEI